MVWITKLYRLFLIILENTPHFFDQERRLFEGGDNW